MTGWLRGFPMAEPLSDADVALLERVVVEQPYPAGHVFVREGDRADAPTAAMFFLIEGSVSVTAAPPTPPRGRAPEGGYGVERTLGPGQVFGAVALVADVPRSATCKAVGPVVVGRLDRRTFAELFQRNAGVHARFQLLIARSLAADLRALRELLLGALASGDEAPLRERFP